MVGNVAGHHPGREGAVRTDDGPGAETDVGLTVERGNREADRRAGTEVAERAGPPLIGTDRRPSTELLPTVLQQRRHRGARASTEDTG